MKIIELKPGWFINVLDHFGFWDFVHYRFVPFIFIAGAATATAVAASQANKGGGMPHYRALQPTKTAEPTLEGGLSEVEKKNRQRALSMLTQDWGELKLGKQSLLGL